MVAPRSQSRSTTAIASVEALDARDSSYGCACVLPPMLLFSVWEGLSSSCRTRATSPFRIACCVALRRADDNLSRDSITRWHVAFRSAYKTHRNNDEPIRELPTFLREIRAATKTARGPMENLAKLLSLYRPLLAWITRWSRGVSVCNVAYGGLKRATCNVNVISTCLSRWML